MMEQSYQRSYSALDPAYCSADPPGKLYLLPQQWLDCHEESKGFVIEFEVRSSGVYVMPGTVILVKVHSCGVCGFMVELAIVILLSYCAAKQPFLYLYTQTQDALSLDQRSFFLQWTAVNAENSWLTCGQ